MYVSKHDFTELKHYLKQDQMIPQSTLHFNSFPLTLRYQWTLFPDRRKWIHAFWYECFKMSFAVSECTAGDPRAENLVIMIVSNCYCYCSWRVMFFFLLNFFLSTPTLGIWDWEPNLATLAVLCLFTSPSSPHTTCFHNTLHLLPELLFTLYKLVFLYSRRQRRHVKRSNMKQKHPSESLSEVSQIRLFCWVRQRSFSRTLSLK